MRSRLIFLLFAFWVGAAAAAPLDPQSVENAGWHALPRLRAEKPIPLLVKAEALLDRARFSPGEIDGKAGDNFKQALAAFAAAHGLPSDGKPTRELWNALAATSSDPVLTRYTIAGDDVRGPFAPKIPKKMEAMSELDALGYVSARQEIAEKFHRSQKLLDALNPGADYAPGKDITVIKVDVSDLPEASLVQIDKKLRILKVLGPDRQVLAEYPASIGSREKPAPNGKLKVAGVVMNPTYRYHPKYHFKGVHAKRPFTIKPGPNNPVGVVWIGLSREGYGIHGAPDPSRIGKTQSHGCIRLTNWDALSLASSVKKGTQVDFLGGNVEHSSLSGKRRG